MVLKVFALAEFAAAVVGSVALRVWIEKTSATIPRGRHRHTRFRMDQIR
jgi:hypothetical protein